METGNATEVTTVIPKPGDLVLEGWDGSQEPTTLSVVTLVQLGRFIDRFREVVTGSRRQTFHAAGDQRSFSWTEILAILAEVPLSEPLPFDDWLVGQAFRIWAAEEPELNWLLVMYGLFGSLPAETSESRQIA